MEPQIRPARPDEMDPFHAITAYVFNGNHGDEPDHGDFRPTPSDWTVCAFVDGRMVTTFATISFTARFNGVAAKLGGVSAVGTRPEYRRQSIMGRIMRRAIAERRDRGQLFQTRYAPHCPDHF